MESEPSRKTEAHKIHVGFLIFIKKTDPGEIGFVFLHPAGLFC